MAQTGWTVDYFSAQIRDLHRRYEFQCNIFFPAAIPGATGDAINILAESTTLPGRKIDAVEVDFVGAPYKLAGKVSYSPWRISFRMDDSLNLYKAFRAWSELIFGTQTNLAAFASQYKATQILYQLDENQNQISQISLHGAWVSDVGDLAYDTKDRGIVNLDITWEYDYSVFGPING